MRRQKIYMPIFIMDIPVNKEHFMMSASIRVNKTATQLYIDPYGFAIEDQTEMFGTGIIKKKNGSYSVDGQMMVPGGVVGSCPRGWIKINIQAFRIEEHEFYDGDEKDDEEGTDENDIPRDFTKSWDKHAPAGVIAGIITTLKSLTRTNTETISDSPLILSMKEFALSKIQECKNYLLIESLLYAIDDELDSLNLRESEKAFLREIREIADNKMTELIPLHESTSTIVVGGKPVGSIEQIHSVSYDELTTSIQHYKREDLSTYLANLTEKDMNTEGTIEKAAFIRDYLQ